MTMKLEKYKDKSMSKKRVLLISLSVIVLISVSLILYKTFASFNEHVEFPMMNGKVDYFGNSDIYFVFYKGDELLNEMPQKDNKENLVFERGSCDNGASILWNENEWAPLVKGLNTVKTKCSLYFKEQEKVEIGGTKVSVAESGDGLYKVEHNDLTELGTEWNKTEYRYAGVNPNNYVTFNSETWRIIGLVNVKVGSSVEQRVKIVRTDGVGEQKNFGNYAWDRPSGYTNNWTTSKLKDMLNGIYYESSTGDCYKGSSATQCDFNSGTELPKGLDDTARNMIDKEITWNIGGSSTDNDVTVKQFYERERGTSTGSSNTFPSEWNSTTDVGGKFNGIGLIYPSDYGYATNGGSIGRETCFAEYLYNWSSTSGNYSSECGGTDWLKPSSGWLWTLTPYSSTSDGTFLVSSAGYLYYDGVFDNYFRGVFPVVYLTSSTKIVNGNGTIDEPFQLSVQ